MLSREEPTGMEPSLSSETNRHYRDADMLFKEAQVQSVHGNFEEAKQLLREAVQLYSEHPYAQEFLDQIEQVHPTRSAQATLGLLSDLTPPQPTHPTGRTIPSISAPAQRSARYRKFFNLLGALEGPLQLLIITIPLGWPMLIMLYSGADFISALLCGGFFGFFSLSGLLFALVTGFAGVVSFSAANKANLGCRLLGMILMIVAILISVAATYGIFTFMVSESVISAR